MMMVQATEAISQFLKSVGSIKAKTMVMRYMPAKKIAPKRASIRLSF